MNPVALVRKTSMYGEPDTVWDSLWMWCPACDDLVNIPVNTAERNPSWEWNGDLENVTLSPSLLTSYGVIQGKPRTCHSFVREGQWEFLSDSTHHLSGQTVPMTPLPEWCLR